MEYYFIIPMKPSAARVKNRAKIIYLALSAAALFLGVSCYWFFRSSRLIIDDILNFRVSGGFFFDLPDNGFTDFVRYNLCDGLWIVSGVLFLRFLWTDSAKIFAAYRAAFVLAAMALEILQAFKKVPGTFDAADLLVMACFVLLEHFINYFFTRKGEGNE